MNTIMNGTSPRPRKRARLLAAGVLLFSFSPLIAPPAASAAEPDGATSIETFGTLAGSSVYAFGDSIVAGHTYPRSFVNLVAEREEMRLTKYAKNGATVGPNNDPDRQMQIVNQVRSASSQAPDFVVFDGGTNDAIKIDGKSYEIGAVSGSLDPATFDTKTYTGALEATIHAMKQKWPTAQLVYVAAHKMVSRTMETQVSLHTVTLQAAQKWGVAVADVFEDTALDTRIEAHRVEYTFDNLVNGYPGTNGTGTHPNIAGMTEFYVPVLTAKLVELGPPGGGTTATTMVARHSGKCADVASVSTANGGSVIQYSCSGGANQRWRLEPVGEGYHRIVASHSGKCLEVASASTANGARLQQWDCSAGTHQQWRLRDAGSGYVQIVARHSGRCIDVPSVSTANGARLHQWDCHTGNNQQWRL